MVNPNKNWLPDNYEVPKGGGGNYMRFEQGANKFRILSQPVMGFEYWTADNKPVRLREQPSVRPEDMREDSKIKHFWAFVVYNYRDAGLQILEVTQAGIQREIADLVTNADWGDPTKYDITVTRRGEKLDTEYTVQPSPHKLTPPEVLNVYESMSINLDALFTGADPFDGQKVNVGDEEMMREENPFGTVDIL